MLLKKLNNYKRKKIKNIYGKILIKNSDDRNNRMMCLYVKLFSEKAHFVKRVKINYKKSAVKVKSLNHNNK